MAAIQETVDRVKSVDVDAYKYGFVTDIESEKAPKGLNEDIVRYISGRKSEPEWMTQWRLDAYQRWLTMTEPKWARVDYPPIDFQDLYYYSAPKSMSGPQSLGSGDGYPGQRLGMPAEGTDSLAGLGRRTAAVMIDWLIAYGLAGLGLATGVFSQSFLATAVLLIWFALGVASVRLFGFTPGQYLLGLRVASVDNRLHVGTGRAAARGLLIALVLPALFTDSDGRGFHDRLTGTAVVRR